MSTFSGAEAILQKRLYSQHFVLLYEVKKGPDAEETSMILPKLFRNHGKKVLHGTPALFLL